MNNNPYMTIATTRILILAANPKDTAKLRLDEEVREIEGALSLARDRAQFQLVQKWAVRARDMQRALRAVDPHIVHFSGHGGGEAGLALEDRVGQAQLVSAEALAALFETADSLECVLLNACYSEVQASAIAQSIPYVIGMNQAVGDRAALEFSIGFYDALFAGRSIERAFKEGCISIRMAGIPEHLTPVLKSRSIQAAPTSSVLAADRATVATIAVPDAIASAGTALDTTSGMVESAASTAIPAAAAVPVATAAIALDEPEGQVPLDSPLYIERPPIEARCYETIRKPGALIRIKAPRQMGKSSLMLRILDRAVEQRDRAVLLNLQSAGSQVLSSLDSFLYWFCARIERKLNLPAQLDTYWQGPMGSNDKCTDYFELSLLETLGTPLALCLDEVDELFKHPAIASDFFGLLRAWHEEAKINPIWQNLRLVITHSKEVYIPLNINQSPFNVGVPIDLPPLNRDQTVDLIQRHRLQLPDADIEQLVMLLGGHPYLLRLALYHLAWGNRSLASLLAIAPTEEWAYGEHLRRHLLNLQEDKTLLNALKQVVATPEPVQIETAAAFKLSSMGLVRFQGNAVRPLCDLYRRYFQDRLGV